MRDRLKRFMHYMREDLWRTRLSECGFFSRIKIRVLRVTVLALRGFRDDHCSMRASALTFLTMMSIVPLVALIFGVAKGFNAQEMVKTHLSESMEGQEEAITFIVEKADLFLESTNAGVIAGFGVFLLFWTVIKLLGNIEKSFNHIWGINRPRTITRRFNDYLSFMLIVPFLFIASTSAMGIMAASGSEMVESWTFLGEFRAYVKEMLAFLPMGGLWILFTYIYLFMPNTKVNFFPGLMAGLVTSLLFQCLQWLHIYTQIGAAKLGAVYGSFAALPLFLIWLQLSWLIVLLGVEIAYAIQNSERHEFEPDVRNASPRVQRLVSLGIVQIVVERFRRMELPPTAEELSATLDAPLRLVNIVITQMIDAKILIEVQPKGMRGVGYNPAQSPDNFTLQGVVDLLDQRGSDRMPLKLTEAMERIAERLDTMHERALVSEDNVHLGGLYELPGQDPRVLIEGRDY